MDTGDIIIVLDEKEHETWQERLRPYLQDGIYHNMS